ncbi:MAG: sulfotransferase domain-containing protein [Oscillochloris sp.]|nr:sulfotransferase domain-containing protein [Oscillochloris sp.]
MNLRRSMSRTISWLTQRGSRQHLPFEPKPNYYYLASFPKSGSTWVRFLLASILADKELSLKEFGHYVPDSHIKGDQAYLNDPDSLFNRARRQYLKTHLGYDYRFRNAIYIVRDGRDTLTSYYHWLNARRETAVSLREIILDQTPMGNWSSHVVGWMQGRSHKLVVRYEELFNDTERQLRHILDFTGMEVDDQRIRRAIEAASFENMRRKEEVLRNNGNLLAHAVGEKKPALFVRKGGSGDWRNLFSPEDEAIFWKHHRSGMIAAGYDSA